MKHKILIAKGSSVFKILTIDERTNSGDITIVPNQSIYLDRAFIDKYKINDKLVIETSGNKATIHHYSAHSESGQRHIKFNPRQGAQGKIQGNVFKDIEAPIPLVSVVGTTARKPDGEQKGTSIGFNLPIDTDYCVIDMLAIPLDMEVDLNLNMTIDNTKMSQESFGHRVFPLKSLAIAMIIRTTNHNACSIPYNVLFQQDEGKTAQIVRVSEKKLEIQISSLSISSSSPE